MDELESKKLTALSEANRNESILSFIFTTLFSHILYCIYSHTVWPGHCLLKVLVIFIHVLPFSISKVNKYSVNVAK